MKMPATITPAPHDADASCCGGVGMTHGRPIPEMELGAVAGGKRGRPIAS